MGVTRSGDGRFEVRVSRNKKRHALGKYDSFEKAVAVYREAERKLLGDWRRVTDRAVVS